MPFYFYKFFWLLAYPRYQAVQPLGATAKYWISEMLNRVVVTCVQFYGDYGYMEEYPIAHMHQRCEGTDNICRYIRDYAAYYNK